MKDNILCIDVGNTRLKWAVLSKQDAQLESEGVCNELSVMITALNKMHSMPVYISLVSAEETKEQLNAWFKEAWKIAPVFIQTEKQFGGLKNAYVKPGDLGVDRWLAMIAAQSLCDGDFCVLDAGTAATIDVVDSKGQHQGGVILPGIQLMIESLNQNTANIAVSKGEAKLLADATSDAVISGVMNAWLGGIERVINVLVDLYPGITVFVTGGDSEQLHELNIKNATFKSELVLMGVGLVARKDYA